MKVLLFILAVAFGLLALATRKHLTRELDPDDDDNQRVEQTIKSSQLAKQNLNYALNRISGTPQKANPTQQGPPAAPATGESPVTAEANQYLRQMSESPENAFTYLEKGLAITNTPETMTLRLNLLQAALSAPGNESTVKDIALRELTSTVLEPQDAPITDPQQVSTIETKRMIISTAYKLFLNASRDAESAYAETMRVLSYQRDQSTKELIMYDCLSRYPELRTRLLTN